MSQIAFIGLGRMGWPMVRNLVRAGLDVAVYDADPSTLAKAKADLHVDVISSPSDFENKNIVITMLPTSRIVKSVLVEWEGGILKALRRGATVVDMSSSDPQETVNLAAEANRRDVVLFDAPVSGGVTRAEAGTLTIMYGGEGLSEQVRPALLALGNSLVPTGPVGSAHAMKALNNVVAGAATVACFEALEAGKHFGLTQETMVEIWNSSTGQSFVTSTVLPEHVLNGAYDSGFRLPLYAKDVGVATSVFDSVGVEANVAQAVSETFQSALELLGDVDHTRLGQFISQN